MNFRNKQNTLEEQFFKRPRVKHFKAAAVTDQSYLKRHPTLSRL